MAFVKHLLAILVILSYLSKYKAFHVTIIIKVTENRKIAREGNELIN